MSSSKGDVCKKISWVKRMDAKLKREAKALAAQEKKNEEGKKP